MDTTRPEEEPRTFGNCFTILIELKQYISQLREDDAVQKQDVCDVVDSRISLLVQSMITSPYCNNFCFDLNCVPETSDFARMALLQMEEHDMLEKKMQMQDAQYGKAT